MRDVQTGTTTRVSVDNALVNPNAGDIGVGRISAYCRYVVFISTAGVSHAEPTRILRSPVGRTCGCETCKHKMMTCISVAGIDYPFTPVANGVSYEPSISADGGFVAFTSYADNLVSGDGYN